MSFAKRLERLVNATERKKGLPLGQVIVNTTDLRDLIYHFNRIDKELREQEQNFKQKEFDYRTQCQSILSAGRLEADNMPDKLAELEKLILDYYLDKGYEINIGGWGFNIEIESDYKSKQLIVYFCEADGEDYEHILRVEAESTKEMFNKAIEFFRGKK